MKLSFFVLCFMAANGSVYGYSYFERVNVFHLYRKLNTLEEKVDQYFNRLKEMHGDMDGIVNATSIFDIRFDTLPAKCITNSLPKSCAEATACTRRSGIYKILVEKFSPEPFLVECDVKTEGGGWTLIQRRQDGSVDFYRNWTEYQRGFGNIQGEFFIGLDKLYALTNFNGPQELLVVLTDKNETRKAFYSNFVIAPERYSYALIHLGDYSGDAGDALAFQLGAKFTTRDKNNSKYELNCASIYAAAWWYKDCHTSNLNGKYGDNEYGRGVCWSTFRGYTRSIAHAAMMIRRRTY